MGVQVVSVEDLSIPPECIPPPLLAGAFPEEDEIPQKDAPLVNPTDTETQNTLPRPEESRKREASATEGEENEATIKAD